MVAVGCMFKVIYIVLESKCPSTTLLPLEGWIQIDRIQDASQGLQPLQEAEELNRGEKKVREVED